MILKTFLLLAGLTSFFTVNSLLAQPNKAAPDGEQFHPTRIIAKLKAGEKAGLQLTALKQQGLKVQRQFSLLPQVVVLDLEDQAQAKAAQALPPQARAKALREQIARLQATGLYEYVEPDYIRTISATPNDSAFTDGTLWALHNFGQSNGVAGADIGAISAWDITTGSTNVIVAVVDTGIRYTHQDLTNQMWRDPASINFVCGTNAVAGNSDPMDDNGHGSHVSGTIGAAANDSHPQVGVAWKVRLMACKFLDSSGSGYISDEIACLQFALAKSARIINASYGSSYFSQTEFEAIRSLRDHGVLFVAAAGNNGQDNASAPSYPASFDLYNIISVAAVDRSDNLASFSNFGKTRVHLGAPGVTIFSCWTGSDSAYNTIDGTSMATPHVVGSAALVLSQYPAATLTELRRRILDGAVPIPSLTNTTVTGGRLNVYNSLVATPTGNLELEVSPRIGSSLTAGKSATLYAVVSDLRPVTNATVTASITAFTNLTLLDGGISPDAIPGDGVYTVTFLVPTNQTTLQVTLVASAPGWPSVTNLISYPVIFPPPNDDFANRIAIPPGNCLVTVTGSNINASKEAGEPIHAGRPDGRSVWWSWTAPFTGPVKISTVGSGFDTLLSVYTGSAVNNLTVVAEDDDASYYDLYSAVKFSAVAGTQYQIAVDGFAADQGQIVLGVLPMTSSVTLGEALDAPALVWSTGGDESWLGQNCVAHDGADAARSGPIEANGQSWMETTVTGPGTLMFWWKVSSESGYDYLHFSVNGVEQTTISGEVDWQQQHSWLNVGTNTLRWTYSKDYSVSAGQDAGWVDQVSFVPVARAIPGLCGDLDGDGQPTVLDLVLLIGYLRDTNSLRPEVAVFADVNGDGLINSNDISALADAIMGRTALRVPVDTDGDGIPDVLERLMGLNPTNAISFGDGIADGDRDFDMDGISNARELALGLDPMRADTDGDGWSDDAEIAAGSNPLDASSRPYVMVMSSPPVALVLPANQGKGGMTNNTVVASPPVALVLPANEGRGGLTNNTVVAAPPVALVLPADQGSGGLTNNTVIAFPPVAFLLPVNQGAGGLTNNTVVAAPPVALVLPADQGSGGLTNNTVIAFPPVAFLLPANQGAGGLTNNTVIAMPPVRIQIGTP
jgi:subtilisin family serine protease